MAAFHTALIADYLATTATPRPPTSKALLANRVSPRVVEAYGRYPGARRPRRRRRARSTKSPSSESAWRRWRRPGLARIAAEARSPIRWSRNAEDGVAEGLFGIAASLTDRPSADVSILYLRMALYLRPDLALAQICCWPTVSRVCGKYDDAIAIYRKVDKSSPYYRMAAMQAARRRSPAGPERRRHRAICKRAGRRPMPRTAKPGSRWAMPIAPPTRFADGDRRL